MYALPPGNKNSEITRGVKQIRLKEMVTLNRREEPRLGSEIASVEDGSTRAFNQKPIWNESAGRGKRVKLGWL